MASAETFRQSEFTPRGDLSFSYRYLSLAILVGDHLKSDNKIRDEYGPLTLHYHFQLLHSCRSLLSDDRLSRCCAILRQDRRIHTFIGSSWPVRPHHGNLHSPRPIHSRSFVTSMTVNGLPGRWETRFKAANLGNSTGFLLVSQSSRREIWAWAPSGR